MGTGLILKRILREKGMTIKSLAQKSGISANTLYSITKRDSKNVDPILLEKIAEALDCDFWELCGAVKKIPLDENVRKMLDGVDSLHYDSNLPELKSLFQKLNATGQEVALERIKELTEIPRYQRKYQRKPEEGEQSAVDPQENQ